MSARDTKSPVRRVGNHSSDGRCAQVGLDSRFVQVLHATVTDMDTLIAAARVGESADPSSVDPSLTNLVDELRAGQTEAKRLVATLDAVMVHALDNVRPTPSLCCASPRHVSFADNSDFQSLTTRGRPDKRFAGHNKHRELTSPCRQSSPSFSNDNRPGLRGKRSPSPWPGRGYDKARHGDRTQTNHANQ
jgi:hypothetical protein